MNTNDIIFFLVTVIVCVNLVEFELIMDCSVTNYVYWAILFCMGVSTTIILLFVPNRKRCRESWERCDEESMQDPQWTKMQDPAGETQNVGWDKVRIQVCAAMCLVNGINATELVLMADCKTAKYVFLPHVLCLAICLGVLVVLHIAKSHK